MSMFKGAFPTQENILYSHPIFIPAFYFPRCGSVSVYFLQCFGIQGINLKYLSFDKLKIGLNINYTKEQKEFSFACPLSAYKFKYYTKFTGGKV